MKRILKWCLLCCFCAIIFCVPVIAKAQGGPGGPGDPACDPGCNCVKNPDGSFAYYCPIDDEVYVLLVIAVAYGLKKLKDPKRTTAEIRSLF